MPDGFTRSPNLLKGAIIQFSAPMLVPIPNIIIFQYNPETLSRTLTAWSPLEKQNLLELGKSQEAMAGYVKTVFNALAQPFDPKETFSVVLELDAADALEEPEKHPVAVRAGVADRIAAFEMLLYPPGDRSPLNTLSVSMSATLNAAGNVTSATLAVTGAAQRLEVPVVLFFWGRGRIVPVRITSFTVEEQSFSPTLYPIRAKVTVGMQVLDENDLVNILGQEGPQTASVKIAKACYTFTRAQKEALAMANILNSVESIMGMLPF
jgi:hypothetical protein